jgi:hypothetical protein
MAAVIASFGRLLRHASFEKGYAAITQESSNCLGLEKKMSRNNKGDGVPSPIVPVLFSN